ncbi:PTS sugar transporter subunit IIA [Secundilactobacillus kimchicus]|uniref:PTS sugar transporter subunit IIA n=1 Tax=Secundilactobacillus kimchicus TaxID=528209 RepID=UPI0024A8C44D|nr:PTS sugar transporter subunit IIA [Secundilactobacillus kimchicus]
MILDLLTFDTVQVVNGKNLSWEEAIQLAAAPLVKNNTVEKSYVSEMIKVVKDEGPYINIGPQIALAHSRPDGKVHRVGLSLLKTNYDVELVNPDHPIKLWFVLAAIDSDSHLSLIKELMTILTNSQTVQMLMEKQNAQEIIDEIFKAVSK